LRAPSHIHDDAILRSLCAAHAELPLSAHADAAALMASMIGVSLAGVSGKPDGDRPPSPTLVCRSTPLTVTSNLDVGVGVASKVNSMGVLGRALRTAACGGERCTHACKKTRGKGLVC